MGRKIFVSNSHGARVFNVDDILYFASVGGRVLVHYEVGEKEEIFDYCGTLKSVEKSLEGNGFIRIHKSYVIPADRIEYIGNSYVIIRSARKIRLPVGNIYGGSIRERLKKCCNDEMIIL